MCNTLFSLLKCIPAFSHLANFYPGSWDVVQGGGAAQCSSESSISSLVELPVRLTWWQIWLFPCCVGQFSSWSDCMAVSPLSCSLKCSLNAAFSGLGRKGNWSYISCCCVLKECIKQKYLCTLPRFTKPVVLQIPSVSLNEIYLTFTHLRALFLMYEHI